jgi:predicted nucleic acid-binding protein
VIVVDASVLIAHLDARDAHHERAERVLGTAAGQDFIASPVTIAEVLTGPARVGRLSEAQVALGLLGVREQSMRRDAPVRLAQLRVTTQLKLPDCCVLLAAEDVSAEAVASFDDRLAATARKLGFGTP